MFRTVVGLLFVSLAALVSCEDCSKAFETLHDCVKGSQQQIPKTDDHQDKVKKEADFKACFTKSGCKEPSFNRPAGKGEKTGNDAKNACRKQVEEKVHNQIKSCVQKKTGINLPDKKDDGKGKEEHGERGHGEGKGEGKGKGGFDELKTLCTTDQQRNDTRKCLRGLNGGDKDREAERQQFEQRFKEQCDNKKACFQKLSAECQKKINETKAAACECAKSELAGAAGTQLNDEMTKCGAGEQEHENKDRPTTFTERLIEKICSKKEDKCDKPFKGGNGNWKGGKGKEGKRFSSSK